MAEDNVTPRPLPAHVRAEAQRILDAAARRILDEQLAGDTEPKPSYTDEETR